MAVSRFRWRGLGVYDGERMVGRSHERSCRWHWVVPVFILAGCGLDGEPSVPCGSMIDLTADGERSFLPDSKTVLALSQSDGGITVVRECDITSEDCDGEVSVMTLQQSAHPTALALGSTGDTVYYVDEGDLLAIDLVGDKTPKAAAIGGDVGRLIGSLRGDDWVLVENSTGEVSAVRFDRTQRTFTVQPLDLPGKSQVVALGDRTAVARVSKAGRDELYLVRINPTKQFDNGGWAAAGRVEFLGATVGAASRIEIVAGDKPDANEPFPNTPYDRLVVVSSGSGLAATTTIYSVLDGEVVDQFWGAVQSGTRDLAETPGLSGVSPDGTKLAYITRRGSLAVRDLETQGSCMVRSSDAGTHTLAGFSNSGTMLFQAEDGDFGQNVFSYDPASRNLASLTEGDTKRVLSGVPGNLTPESPWAVVSLSGLYGAQEDGLDLPLGINTQDVTFLPRRDNEELWLLEASDGEGSSTEIRLRRIAAGEDGGVGLTFDVDSDPTVSGGATNSAGFVEHYNHRSRLCLSSGALGHFSRSCSSQDEPRAWIASGIPQPDEP